MVEFQARVATASQTLLSALRGAPACLPPPQLGVQLQRVRFDSVGFNHDFSDDATIVHHAWRETAPVAESVDAMFVQAVIGVTLDLARTQSIQDSPNVFVASEFKLVARLVLAIEAFAEDWTSTVDNVVLARAGLKVLIDGAVVTSASLPAWLRDAVNAWIAQQFAGGTGGFADDIARLQAFATSLVEASLPPDTQIFSLSQLFPKNVPLANAGLSMDSTSQALSLRADSITDNDLAPRNWQQFLDGAFDVLLGNNDWVVAIPSEDLELTIQTLMLGAIDDALGDNAWRLITLEVHYSAPQPNAVRFTITPWFKLPVAGTENVSIYLDMSLDATAGVLQVDVDARSVGELAGELEESLDALVSLINPIVGAFAIVALHELVADLEAAASNALATAGSGAITGVESGATFVALPGSPLQFRARFPAALPQGTPGRIGELRALPDTVAVGGSWRPYNWHDAELTLHVGQFNWKVPTYSCSNLDGTIATLREDPTRITFPQAWIELGTTGSAPIKVCGIDILSDGGAPGGIQVTRNSDLLPATICVSAAAAFATLASKQAVRLNVRTTAGTVLVVLDAPAPFSPTDTARLISILKGMEGLCVVAVNALTGPGGRFNLDWIPDPLSDPDPEVRREGFVTEIVSLEVQGLAPGSRLTLGRGDTDRLAEVAIQSGPARLSYWAPPGEPVESLWLQHETGGASQARDETRSIVLTRQVLAAAGRLPLPGRPMAIQSVPAWGAGRFAVAVEDACLLIEPASANQARVAGRWAVPGLRGVLSTRQGLLAWGAAGTRRLDAGDADTPCGCHQDARAVTAAASCGNRIALLRAGLLVLANSSGGEIASHPFDDAEALGFAGRLLVIGTAEGLLVHRLGERGRLELLTRYPLHGVTSLVRSATTGSLFAHGTSRQWLQITPDGELGARYATLPWDAQVAVAGNLIAKLGSGSAVDFLRATTPAQATIPRGT